MCQHGDFTQPNHDSPLLSECRPTVQPHTSLLPQYTKTHTHTHTHTPVSPPPCPFSLAHCVLLYIIHWRSGNILKRGIVAALCYCQESDLPWGRIPTILIKEYVCISPFSYHPPPVSPSPLAFSFPSLSLFLLFPSPRCLSFSALFLTSFPVSLMFPKNLQHFPTSLSSSLFAGPKIMYSICQGKAEACVSNGGWEGARWWKSERWRNGRNG